MDRLGQGGRGRDRHHSQQRKVRPTQPVRATRVALTKRHGSTPRLVAAHRSQDAQGRAGPGHSPTSRPDRWRFFQSPAGRVRVRPQQRHRHRRADPAERSQVGQSDQCRFRQDHRRPPGNRRPTLRQHQAVTQRVPQLRSHPAAGPTPRIRGHPHPGRVRSHLW